MKWVLGSDHAGVALKASLEAFLKEKGFETEDLGGFDPLTSCDYPDYADKVCEALLTGQADMGILVCGTGIGVSMRANRFNGIRATLVHDGFTAQAAKEHSNANVVCFGERVTTKEVALHALEIFLNHTFQGGNHSRRLEKLDTPTL